MNPTKQKIINGENVLKEQLAMIEQVKAGNIADALISLLQDRVTTIEGRLVTLRQQWEREFEAESAEVNANIEILSRQAEKYKDKEPQDVAMKISDILHRWKVSDATATLDQETLNDEFYDLKGHVEFMIKFNKNKK